jgi:hypothetical protein
MKYGFYIYMVLDKAFISRELACQYLKTKYSKRGRIVPNVAMTQCTLVPHGRFCTEASNDVFSISEQFVFSA